MVLIDFGLVQFWWLGKGESLDSQMFVRTPERIVHHIRHSHSHHTTFEKVVQN